MVGGPLGGSVGGLVGPCRGGSGFESFGSSLRVLDLSMCGPEEMQIEGTLPLDIGDQCPLLEQVRRDEEAKRRRGHYLLMPRCSAVPCCSLLYPAVPCCSLLVPCLFIWGSVATCFLFC